MSLSWCLEYLSLSFGHSPLCKTFVVKYGGYGDFYCSQLNSLAVSQLPLLSFPVFYQAEIILW